MKFQSKAHLLCVVFKALQSFSQNRLQLFVWARYLSVQTTPNFQGALLLVTITLLLIISISQNFFHSEVDYCQILSMYTICSFLLDTVVFQLEQDAVYRVLDICPLGVLPIYRVHHCRPQATSHHGEYFKFSTKHTTKTDTYSTQNAAFCFLKKQSLFLN